MNDGRKNGGYKIYPIVIFTALLFCYAVLFKAYAQTYQETDTARRRTELIEKAGALLKAGKTDEGLKLTSKIPSLSSLSEDERKGLFEVFYEGFVALSKTYRLKDAVQLSAEWTRIFPEEKISMLYYASLLSDSGQNLDAAEKFDAGFRLPEKYRKIDEPLLLSFYHNAAGCYADLGEYGRSLDYAAKMEKLEPDYYGIDSIKCRVYYYLNRFEEGLKVCEDVFKRNPKTADVLDYLTFAGYHRQKKDYKMSLKIVTDALRKFPLADGVAMTAAADQIRLGNYYQALMLCFREDMIAGIHFYNNKNISQLRQTINDYISGSDTAESLRSKKMLQALKLMNEKKYEPALKLLEDLDENVLIYRESIEIFKGEALEGLGKYKEAENVYKFILSRDPTLIMAYCKLFELYYKRLNDKQKALEYFDKAKTIKPDHWKVDQIKNWLEEQK